MKEKEIELKTFEIRVTNTKDQNYLKNYIYKYRHWQNILTILTVNLFKTDNKLNFRTKLYQKIKTTTLITN